MKLILKDGQELIITRANDTYSYEGYKDGLGNDMNRNIVATISIFNSDKSLNTIKDMITDENRTGFKIIYGNTQKDYTGMKIESISEEIGYANPKYFFKIFKKIVLCTPLEFRKQNKNSGDENAVQREKTEI